MGEELFAKRGDEYPVSEVRKTPEDINQDSEVKAARARSKEVFAMNTEQAEVFVKEEVQKYLAEAQQKLAENPGNPSLEEEVRVWKAVSEKPLLEASWDLSALMDMALEVASLRKDAVFLKSRILGGPCDYHEVTKAKMIAREREQATAKAHNIILEDRVPRHDPSFVPNESTE